MSHQTRVFPFGRGRVYLVNKKKPKAQQLFSPFFHYQEQHVVDMSSLFLV